MEAIDQKGDPGSLFSIGGEDRPARALVHYAAEGATRETSVELAVEAITSPGNTCWLDMVGPAGSEFDLLMNALNLHPLAIKATKPHLKLPNPRAELYDGTVYIRWYWMKEREDDLEFVAINIFWGPNYVLTVGHESSRIVDELFDAATESDILKEGSALLLHRLLDAVVDQFFPTLDKVTELVDDLQDAMFEQPSKENLKQLFEIKSRLLAIHKIIAPQRESVNILTRANVELAKPEFYPYFVDIYDHLVQIGDIIDTAREVVNGSMDIYLSSISNRLNEVMRRLTLFAAIFVPLTLLTSFFGMNLAFITENPYSETIFYWALAVTLVVTAWIMVSGRNR